MKQILFITLYFIFIYVSYSFLRKSPWLVVGFFIIAPLISLPLWLGKITDWFIIAKTYTIVLYLLWIQGARYIKRFNKNTVLLSGIYALLIINILEAIYRDVQLGNYFNAGAGLLLCITIPLVNEINVDCKGKYNDLLWNMSRLWVITYTIWNITFIYSSYSYGVGVHVAVLGVPLIVGLINPKIWLQARVITLATHMMARIFIKNYIDSMYINITEKTSFYTSSVKIMSVVAFVLAVCCIVTKIFNHSRNINIQMKDKSY